MATVNLIRPALIAAALLLSACEDAETGPVRVSAIGSPPQLQNPNLRPIDPASAWLAEAVAQGLVRFNGAGEVEPALAQSWIVSDDGLRYTFRIRRMRWPNGEPVTAEQVASRLRAAYSRASRNPLKPVLGAIENVVAMTDQVVEIQLRGPRPYQLDLLAQPLLGIIVDNEGTGPFTIREAQDGVVRLALPRGDEDDADERHLSDHLLRGETAAQAIARFANGEADFVTGGTLGDLPLVRAARLPGNRLAFDPAAGLFGLAFASNEGPLAEPAVRRALSMAVDRDALSATFGVPTLQPRTSIAPLVAIELPQPSQPDWVTSPMPMRRQMAARTIAGLAEPLRLRVAMPESPGYRLLFAHLRRDWRLIGVDAVRVAPAQPAELRLIDEVAPAMLSTWYLRHFTCDAARICDPAADEALQAGRVARTAAERQGHIAIADQILTGLVPFIPLGSPVRWSLVSPRLTGFRTNVFARHPAGTLIAEEF